MTAALSLVDGTTIAPANQVGRRVDRYILADEIASGGMATVHLGRLLGSVGFSRTVAVKRLHPMMARDPEFVSMFTDEARVAARMRHSNIAATLDVISDDGELFLVMEYIHGESIAQLVRRLSSERRSVPAPIAVAVAAGMLAGLHAVHEATTERGEPLGAVHRDVSPQNVIVGTDGIARVLDFGIAKAVGRLARSCRGELKGKRAYLAPEQLRGLPIDRRLDVYAASVVLWEMLTGHRLFAGDSERHVIGQILGAPVEPPSRYAPGIPPELDALVLRGLSRYPCHRFSTALEMATALERTVLVPTAREVGAWVESVARDSLAIRSEIVRRIEGAEPEARLASGVYSVPPRSPSPEATPIATATTHVTTLVDAGPPAAVQSHRRRRLALLLPLKLLLVAALAFGHVQSRAASHRTSASASLGEPTAPANAR